MTALAWIMAIVLAGGFGMAGLAKITKHKMMVESAEHFGISMSLFQGLGVAEVAGAVAVILGLLVDDLSSLGVLAAFGLLFVGVGAVAAHVRANDDASMMIPPTALAVAALIYIAIGS